MFKENKRLAAADTLIGQGTIAEGKMVSEANLRIEGEYRGDIECKGDVIIGECGVARSNIIAHDITLAGRLFGDIETKGRLIITSSGQITGNVKAHSLIIQDGGLINGSCHMEPLPAAKLKSNDEAIAKTEPQQEQKKSRQAG
ncbi:polymer-forming cytoskeletal protein [Paenibacillus sp. HB172176]|uniref:bactofilin family protein n=1 Tax=Paenibacillus sp. HB172176 TaxID=2493690 RepID=UPI00143A70F7|nr:polymer-forming cytoskeletal protein [Paenibacillus sp. HB172176]